MGFPLRCLFYGADEARVWGCVTGKGVQALRVTKTAEASSEKVRFRV